jgi:hypothetical protein
MRRESTRIVLLRSGRHLGVAIDALSRRFPGCRIAVVGTPGAQPAIEQAGIAASDVFVFSRARFQPLAFLFSRTALAVRRWRYDQVAILWNDPDGQGQGNVDRTALTMSPRGYLAVTPDGTVVERALLPQLRTEAVRAMASVGVASALGLLLYVPALVFGPFVAASRRLGPGKAGRHALPPGPAEARLYAGQTGPAKAGLYVGSAFRRTGENR